MQLVFSDQAFPADVTKTIFLEGPSPRSKNYEDWKQTAVKKLEALNFDGTVFIPIPSYRFLKGEQDEAKWSYYGQVEWEVNARLRADKIVCYVDRVIDIEDEDLGMPGFTTNIEFGEDLSSGKLVYGRPDTARKNRYMDQRIEMLKGVIHQSLDDTLQAAIDQLGEGAKRSGGEAAVPLHIWETEHFQSWYENVKAAGNRLDDAKVLFQARFKSGPVFCFILWVNVWVTAESRAKSNEMIISRKGISAVVAYHKDKASGQTKVVLVKEFRSTVNNKEGYVYELPAGSSPKNGVDPAINAQHELDEEVGLLVEDVSRFRFVGKRQLVATQSTHQATVYAIELTDAEMAQLQKAAEEGVVFGEVGTSEKTYVVISDVQDIYKVPMDYATLGMVFEALHA